MREEAVLTSIFLPLAADEDAADPSEAETHQDLRASFAKIQETTYADGGHGLRAVHAKAHGLLRGRFRVLDGLPPELAQGLCAQPVDYEVALRFSTNPGDLLDDSVSTPRGLALKVMGVPGERLPDSGGATQDFVLANGPAFVAPDAKAFAKNLKLLAATTDTPQIFKKGLSAVLRGVESVLEAVGTQSSTIVALGGQPATHILGETFYSQAALLWGKVPAKVSVAPVSPALVALHGAAIDFSSPDRLRELVAEHFRANEGEWELRVQLRTDREAMPIEDVSVPWPEDLSPYRPVARIRVPSQDSFGAENRREIDERLAFNPWHALAAHRPLGSVMRARRATYGVSAAFRAERNGCPIHEPSGATLGS